MHIVNHAAVGAGIALLVQQPALALPLAFLSHFVLDALPHYGIRGDEGYPALFKLRRTVVMVVFDIIGVAILTALLWGQAWYVFAAAVLAVSPDTIWLYRYFGFERFGKKPPKPGPITRFHQNIQWGERLWGVYVEVPFTIILLLLVARTV
jgi:hypothetical protein